MEEVRITEKLEEHNNGETLEPPIMSGVFDYTNQQVTYLVYYPEVLGLNGILFYAFISNKLRAMGYSFIGYRSSNELYATDFDNVNSALSKKYGSWKSDVDNLSEVESRAGLATNFGELLNRGGYRRIVEWQSPRTVIRHQIISEDDGVAHRLIYESVEHYETRKGYIQDDI